MPAITRLEDMDTGHDACPATKLIEGSPNVYINGKPAGRVRDAYAAHGCIDHPSHTGHIASGSSSVFINSRSAGRVGDTVDCGGTVASGSSNVFVGG